MADEDDNEDEVTYRLVLLFDTDEPEFARGWEAAIVWAALKQIDPWDSHEAQVHGENVEMMLRIAEATHRPLTTHDSDADWFECLFGPVHDPKERNE